MSTKKFFFDQMDNPVPICYNLFPPPTRSDPATPVAGKRATLRCETGSSNPSAVVNWRHMGKRMEREAAHTRVKVREGGQL